jgi:cellulose synthase/poly-beta-1,6-N-acetylglucosamine synthase-like glycosyltransferase
MRIKFYPFFLAGVILVLIFSVRALLIGDSETIFLLTLGYLGYEVGLGLFLYAAAALGLRAWSRRRAAQTEGATRRRRDIAVVIAAHNESACIADTLKSVFAQADVNAHVIVASDGSTDGMNEALIRTFQLEPDSRSAGIAWTRAVPLANEKAATLTLLALPKVGKGPALNSGLAFAEADVTVTLDADTQLAPDALYEIALAFDDAEMIAAGGFIYVRDVERGGWIVRHQYLEFLRNFTWRIGLAHCGICLQISGAFGAFRTRTLKELGGFAVNSLVEDYEITHRIHKRFHEERIPYRIGMIPGAVAYTDSPKTVQGFVKQRTRWFAGFIQTLWDYRTMIGDGRYGAVGRFMLPVKCFDALLPIWGISSLLILLSALSFGREEWKWAAGGLFAAKWSYDQVMTGVMLRWHRRFFPSRPFAVSKAKLWFCIMTEGVGFHWFRQAAVLNAYRWVILRIQRWEQARWATAPEAIPQTAEPEAFTPGKIASDA